MLKVELDKENGTVTLMPEGALSAQDFEYASSVIDYHPLLEQHYCCISAIKDNYRENRFLELTQPDH